VLGTYTLGRGGGCVRRLGTDGAVETEVKHGGSGLPCGQMGNGRGALNKRLRPSYRRASNFMADRIAQSDRKTVGPLLGATPPRWPLRMRGVTGKEAGIR
jgi:hypothetical protein